MSRGRGLSRYWVPIAFAAIAVAFVVWASVYSASYETCRDERSAAHSKESYFGQQIAYFVVCEGVAIDSNGELLTALATIVLAVFTGTLWITTDQQARFTKATVDHMRRTERAFVFLENFEVTYTVAQRAGDAPRLSSLAITPRWRNSGKTPTRNLELRVTVREWADGDLPEGHDYFYQDPPLESVIGPNSNEWSPTVTFADFPAREAAMEGLQTIYVWGEARYRDVFDDTPRYTRFCSRMHVIEANDDFTVQFSAWGPYNRSDYEDEA